MKTIRVEDELHREIKRKAVDTDETLEQLAARYLREGLQREAGVAPTERPKDERVSTAPRKPRKRELPSADELAAEVERIEAAESNGAKRMVRSVMNVLADDPGERGAPDALESVKAWLGDDYVPIEDEPAIAHTGPIAAEELPGPPDGKWMVEGQYSDPDGQLVTPFFKITEDGATRWEDYEKEELPPEVVSMLELELMSAKPKIRLKEVKG